MSERQENSEETLYHFSELGKEENIKKYLRNNNFNIDKKVIDTAIRKCLSNYKKNISDYRKSIEVLLSYADLNYVNPIYNTTLIMLFCQFNDINLIRLILYQDSQRTKNHNVFIDMFRGKRNTDMATIMKAMRKHEIYKSSSDSTIEKEAKLIKEKLDKVNDEYIKWYEVLFVVVLAYLGYLAPMLLLKFQVKMRQMAMEDEVMSYQVIILMLMRLERVDVEMILEWLERYADIFKDQISRCLNNYESGAWESLEAMKDEVTYQDFIRIIESLQSAVEKVPIREAFEELDSDRDYYKNKRKETNERLIKTKGMIGKVIGFAPMVTVFVGYLIVPLVFMGLKSMTSSMDQMSSMSN